MSFPCRTWAFVGTDGETCIMRRPACNQMTGLASAPRESPEVPPAGSAAPRADLDVSTTPGAMPGVDQKGSR